MSNHSNVKGHCLQLPVFALKFLRVAFSTTMPSDNTVFWAAPAGARFPCTVLITVEAPPGSIFSCTRAGTNHGRQGSRM